MNLKSEWLVKGHFELKGDSLMQDIRNRLSDVLGCSFKIGQYPAHPGSWRTTFWWHERPGRYAEAQFFMDVAKDYPILSFGVSVEKGIEDRGFLLHNEPDSIMDRHTWDWQRLIEVADSTIGLDIAEIAGIVSAPVNVRMDASRSLADHDGRIHEHVSYVFDRDCWWQRHLGTTSVGKIVERLQEFDQRPQWWVDLYFACDLHPSEVDSIGPKAAADLLLAFRGLRARLNARD